MNLSVLDSIATFDYKFISFINEYSSDKLSLLFKFVTNFGDFYIPVFILFCILIFVKNKWYFYNDKRKKDYCNIVRKYYY